MLYPGQSAEEKRRIEGGRQRRRWDEAMLDIQPRSDRILADTEFREWERSRIGCCGRMTAARAIRSRRSPQSRPSPVQPIVCSRGAVRGIHEASCGRASGIYSRNSSGRRSRLPG